VNVPDGGYSLLVAFDRSSPLFARGVEVGMLWERLCTEQLPVSATVHESNIEMVLRLAEARNCPVRAAELNDEWLAVTYG
jgi:hypothetical protein